MNAAIFSGDGKNGNFSGSVTPNPIIWISSLRSLGPTFWFAFRILITDDLKALVSNISSHEFVENLKTHFTLEGQSWEPFKHYES